MANVIFRACCQDYIVGRMSRALSNQRCHEEKRVTSQLAPLPEQTYAKESNVRESGATYILRVRRHIFRTHESVMNWLPPEGDTLTVSTMVSV